MRQIRSNAKKETDYFTMAEKEFNIDAVTAEITDITSKRTQSPIGCMRASGVYKDCVRKHVIGTHLNKVDVQWLTPQSKVTFGIGSSVHEWAQNTPDLLGNTRRGYWECLGCGNLSIFGPVPTYDCSECGSSCQARKYHELGLKVTQPVQITGHPDMFIEKMGKIRVVEFKTVKREDFMKLHHPFVEHVWQILCYMKLVNRGETPCPVKIDETLGYIFYISKEHTANTVLPFKVFPVFYDQDVFKDVVDKLVLYRDGLKNFPTNIPSLHGDCFNIRTRKFNSESWRAKFCSVMRDCKRIYSLKE